MVVSSEMEDAVDEEPVHFFAERQAVLTPLAFRRLERNDDIAECARDAPELAFAERKREHVRRSVLATPGAVEPADLGIVDEREAQLGRA